MKAAHVESFYAWLRDECLRITVTNLFDGCRKIAVWQAEYNEERPHSSLGYRTQNEFAEVCGRKSYGKDLDCVHSENAGGVSHFSTASATG